ncbi:TPA: TetR/AcrR family transcriptional regulator [Kluyvera intermedia]|nr:MULTISPECIES: TetR/AcrR family transcriptional regulator [Enterobacteriaceae]MDU6683091.1 TetR/AcrR family transcriptional regulator [Enterobacteriaceae bacterium]HAT2203840.1 TetR/AcrR family transcriptional regulator [Kluyvera intermedia]MCL9672063.1 TetR/AcrR family transcriptional regulator [Citrobacter sp. MNAZ 1397]MDV2864041.1 TetR/AcrR family transcriptional regulator [Phytobacter ursingii]GJL38135.1 TetR family transcriptional regulator [Enterobacter hormaechei]
MSRGRPREFDRTEALNQAMKIFWQKGYTATSMNDLYEAMGIKSPSLYAAFGSKEDLYEEVLLHYEQSVAPRIWGHMTSEPSPREAVWLWLERSADMLTQTDMPHGCMVTLSAVGSEGNDRLGQLVRRMRAAGFSLLKTRLEQAQKQGDLPGSVDVEALTRLYVSIQQGMSIQARDGASREILLSIARSAMALWPA